MIDGDPEMSRHLIISERALILKNKVLSRDSGHQFPLFTLDKDKEEKGEGYSFEYSAAKIVPNSDYLMTWRRLKKQVHMFIHGAEIKR